jgi:hypothetical protein
MIVTEGYLINGRQFVRTYSDAGRYVVRDGVSYAEANDPAELGRTYTEGEAILTDESAIDPDDATAADYESALTRLGVEI